MGFLFPHSEYMGLLTSIIGGVACLRFGAGMLVPLQGAAAGCCLRVLLEGAAVRVNAVLSEWCVRFGAACWCRCKVPLQGATGRCHCKMLLGAAAGVAAGFCLRCRCRVLLEFCTCRVFLGLKRSWYMALAWVARLGHLSSAEVHRLLVVWLSSR